MIPPSGPLPPDDDEDDEEDLWFLPGPPEDAAPTDLPWTIAQRRGEFPVHDWLTAEFWLPQQLAEAAAAFARLDERLRLGPDGLAERVALLEVADLLWSQGDRLKAEKIALYRQLRVSTVRDARVLSQADWAMRRMLARVDVKSLRTSGLAEFLGRRDTGLDSPDEWSVRPLGLEFERLEADWWDVYAVSREGHVLTQAAVSFFCWRSYGMSEPGNVVEPMALASSIAAAQNLGGLTFLPLAFGDKYLLGERASPRKLLSNWYKAVKFACLQALLHLDRIETWRRDAVEATSNMSGKTPPALIETLVSLPIVSAELVAERIGVSKMSALRNLTHFSEKGLVKEITGQERYRFWTVQI